YNILHSEPINDLSKLSQYYLNEIIKLHSFHKEEVIKLLGWSLGGRIAIDMAGILEDDGYKNIELYLLDTIIDDETLSAFKRDIDPIEQIEFMKKRYLEEGYSQEYVEKVINASDATEILNHTPIKTKLKYTKAILFKAMRASEGVPDDLNSYTKRLEKNNIDKALDNIRVIPLDVSHFDILNALDEIIEVLD
ncbi:MAG: thioesterase domain-containing protein, partial [Campylobacterota bacterium]|nr:thioesterase domain-containing protein [Campylobacterota bacterium]